MADVPKRTIEISEEVYTRLSLFRPVGEGWDLFFTKLMDTRTLAGPGDEYLSVWHQEELEQLFDYIHALEARVQTLESLLDETLPGADDPHELQ